MRHAPILLAAGYLTLGAAWLGSSPAGAPPDEPSHYLRALAVGYGDFLGQPTTDTPVAPENAAQAAHNALTTRSVWVPAGLAVPPSWFCPIKTNSGSPRCALSGATNSTPVRQATDEAGSLPYSYIPPGLAMRLAGSAARALLFGRLAGAVVTYGLLLACIVLLWDGVSALSLLGLPLAVTPMVLYIGTAMGPSGPEIASAAAFLAFLLRLTRRAHAPGWAWALGITAGAILNLARPLGLFWTIAILAVAAALAGRRTLQATARRAPRASAAAAGILLLTALFSIVWELAFFPSEPHSLSEEAGFLIPSIGAIPDTIAQAIGIFGWVSIPMPKLMYALWGIAFLLLVAPALLRGRLRERRTLDGLVVGVGAAIVALSSFLLWPLGFGLQGRHILALFLAMPLVAGEVLYRNRERVGTMPLQSLAAVTGTLAAIVQLGGWYSNAHTNAVGHFGSWLFVGSADWSPAGGWIPWLTLAVGGSILLVTAAFAALAGGAGWIVYAEPAATLNRLRGDRDPVPSDLDVLVIAPTGSGSSPNLDGFLGELMAALGQLEARTDVLLVLHRPDRSTAEIAEGRGVRLIDAKAAGYGGSLAAAFAASRADYLLTLDADLLDLAPTIAKMWSRRGDAEITIASRYAEGGRAAMRVGRRVFSRLLNTIFSRGLSLRVRDMSSGVRLYRADVVRDHAYEARDYDILQEILVRAYMDGWRVQEIPFIYRARQAGSTAGRLFNFGFAYVRTMVRLWKARNSILAADYDDRAHDSPIPLQRYWQRQRFRHVTDLVEGGGPVLDVGCGSSRILGALPPGSVGVDILLRKLRYGRKFGVPLVQASGFALPFPDQSFSCVLCSQVIEHVPKESPILDELDRTLAPGGRLVLGTPDYANWQWVVTERLYGWFAPGGYADEHIGHYTRGELIEIFTARGFTHESTRYILQGELILAFRKGGAQPEAELRLDSAPATGRFDGAGAINLLPALLGRIVCPSCGGSLLHEDAEMALDCKVCELRYPIEDGIPILMKERAARYRPGALNRRDARS